MNKDGYKEKMIANTQIVPVLLIYNNNNLCQMEPLLENEVF